MRTLHTIIEELLVLEDDIRQQKLTGDQASERYEYLEEAQRLLNDSILAIEGAADQEEDAIVERIDIGTPDVRISR